jgi:hypothetical protein
VKCATTAGAVDAGAAAREWVFAGLAHGSPTRKLHERLHTHRTFDDEQVRLNEKAPISGAFAEPSSGLEPATPFLIRKSTVSRHAAVSGRSPDPISVAPVAR